MKRFLLSFIALSLSLALNAQAFTIDTLTSNNNINLGDAIEVKVQVSNLQNATAPSLGAYDLNLNYAAHLFQISSLVWGDTINGNQLDLNGFGSLHISDDSTIGTLNLFELSFDSAWDLDNLQKDSFTLFSVIFSSLAQGSGNFTIDTHALSDAYGNSLTADAINNTSVAVRAVNVPEPSGLLILIGLIALGLTRAYRINK